MRQAVPDPEQRARPPLRCPAPIPVPHQRGPEALEAHASCRAASAGLRDAAGPLVVRTGAGAGTRVLLRAGRDAAEPGLARTPARDHGPVAEVTPRVLLNKPAENALRCLPDLYF